MTGRLTGADTRVVCAVETIRSTANIDAIVADYSTGTSFAATGKEITIDF